MASGGFTGSKEHLSKEMAEAKETLESSIQIYVVLYEISQLLNCGIDQNVLSILISLCENGVNPEALAVVVKELKSEAEAVQVSPYKPKNAIQAGRHN